MRLSHIVFSITDVMTTNETEGFVRNALAYDENLVFEYYDSEQFEEIASSSRIDELRNESILFTDDYSLCGYAGSHGIATVGVLTKENRDKSFRNVLYCVEDISLMDMFHVNRIFQRCHNIPWIILETDRLVIRELTISDIDDLYRVYQSPKVSEYTEKLYEDKARETEYMREYIEKQYRFFEYGVWGIVRKEDGKLLGRAGLSNRPGYENAELGYVIDSNEWKKGYAYEACSAILEYAKEELEMMYIQAFSRAENIASVKLLEKLGFKEKGFDLIEGKKHNLYLKEL